MLQILRAVPLLGTLFSTSNLYWILLFAGLTTGWQAHVVWMESAILQGWRNELTKIDAVDRQEDAAIGAVDAKFEQLEIKDLHECLTVRMSDILPPGM